MDMHLLASPALIDLILAFTVLEAIVLAVWRKRSGRGLDLVPLFLMLLPGVFLMLALRAALAGAVWPWLPAALAAALVAHLADLRRRWGS
jgi:hypothetical protein